MTTPSHDAFARLVDSATIQTILLVECKASRKPVGIADKSLHPEITCETTGSIEQFGDQSFLSCKVRFHFSGKVDGVTFATISADYVAGYLLDAGFLPDPASIAYFAENNAVFNTWPFFREQAHSLTSKMGLPPFTLPLLKPMRSDRSATHETPRAGKPSKVTSRKQARK